MNRTACRRDPGAGRRSAKRGGAGGIIGSNYVAKAAQDGYTWLFTTALLINTPPFNKNVPFDPVRDFSHVTLAAQNFGQARWKGMPDVPTMQEAGFKGYKRRKGARLF